MSEQADVQPTFQFAGIFNAKCFSKLESLLDIHLKTAVTATPRIARLRRHGKERRRTGPQAASGLFRFE